MITETNFSKSNCHPLYTSAFDLIWSLKPICYCSYLTSTNTSAFDLIWSLWTKWRRSPSYDSTMTKWSALAPCNILKSSTCANAFIHLEYCRTPLLRRSFIHDLIWSLKLCSICPSMSVTIQVHSIFYDHYERSEGEAHRTTVRWRSACPTFFGGKCVSTK